MAAAWVAENPSNPSRYHELRRGQFRKSTMCVVYEDSEAYQGADFAIVQGLTEEFTQIDIFQAKKVDLRDLWNASVKATSSESASHLKNRPSTRS